MSEEFTLDKVRLGRHERRILLMAPAPAAPRRRIEPPAPGRAADEAHRRALRNLARQGLVELGEQYCRELPVDPDARESAVHHHEWMKDHFRANEWEYRGSPLVAAHRRTVRLTRLGEAVVCAAGSALQERQRIRWSRYRNQILRSLLEGD